VPVSAPDLDDSVRPGRRWGGVDLLAVAVPLVALATYLLHGFGGALTRDLAVYAYGGQQVAEGTPPYLGILNRAGPLAHLLPAIGVVSARVGGFEDLLGMRVLYMLFSVASVLLAYLVARNAFASRAAGLVSAGALLSFEGFLQLATYGPREKTPMVLFLLLALWAVTRRAWFTAGVAVGLATLCLQIALLPALAAVGAAVLVSPGPGRLRAGLRVVAGGAATLAVTVAYFAAVGALREFVEAFVLINARYNSGNYLLPDLPDAWTSMETGFGSSVWILLAGMVIPLLLLVQPVWRESRRGSPGTVMVVACASGVVGWLAWSLRDFDKWPDALPVLPYAAVGAGSIVWLLAEHLSRRVLVILTGAVTVLMLVLGVVYSLGSRVDFLSEQERRTAAVLGAVGPDATLLSLEAPQPLVLTGRTNPTRHQMFGNRLHIYVNDTWPGGLRGFTRWVIAQDADIIAVGASGRHRWLPRLSPEYVWVGRVTDWTWLARRSLGPEVIAELRELHRNR
jgi:hypothetical protein